MIDEESSKIISKLIQEVWTWEEINALSPRQKQAVNAMIETVIHKEGLSALTKPRMEGIRELLEAHFFADTLKQPM